MSGNPSAWNPGSLDLEQARRFSSYLDAHDLRPVFLHAGYLINLSCRRGRSAPIYAKSVRLLQASIDRAADLTCEYVVVHMGSRMGTGEEEALAALVEGLARLKAGPADGGRRVTLLLENSAGAGDTAGARFEELQRVLEAAAAASLRLPLGVCLDTAHMWGAGYDLSSGPRVRAVFDDFERLVGLERLSLIHLNDAAAELGSRKDRHEHIGCGLMPPAGLRAVAREPRLRAVPMIMETPGKSRPTDGQRMEDLWRLAGVRPVSRTCP